MATVLERNTQIHHAYLAEHINAYNFDFTNFYHKTVAYFYHQGMSLGNAKDATMGMLNNLVTQQAGMMAYDDISIFLMVMFLVCVPFVLLIPVQKVRF